MIFFLCAIELHKSSIQAFNIKKKKFPKDVHAHDIFGVLCPFGILFIIRLVLIFHVKHIIVVQYLSSAENAARAACIVLADVGFLYCCHWPLSLVSFA